MAPVDCAGFPAALGDRDAASVPVCVGRCDVGAAMIEPDLAYEPAEADDPVAACLAGRVPGAEPGRSAAPVPPSLPAAEVRLDADREVDALVAEGADDGDAPPWDGECDELCRDGDDGGEPSGVFTGTVTGGAGPVGVETDGVVMVGVVTRGVVIGPAVTDGTVAVGTFTDGTESAGTDTDGRLAEAMGTLTPMAPATATDNAPHTARAIRRQRLTDWTTAPLRSNGEPLL